MISTRYYSKLKLNPKLTNRKRFIPKSDTSGTVVSFVSSPFYGDVVVIDRSLRCND